MDANPWALIRDQQMLWLPPGLLGAADGPDSKRGQSKGQGDALKWPRGSLIPEERWPKTLWPGAGVAFRPGAGPLPTCRLSHSLCVTVLPPQDAGPGRVA